jgi:site-specific recombinase XerD
MLEKFFDSSARGLARVRSLRSSLHGTRLDSFAKELIHGGYANITGRRHLRSAEHFVYWANHNRILLPQWNDGLLEGFLIHLRRRRCAYGHAVPENQRTGASLFLRHLRTAGFISNPPVDSTDRPALLISFRRWMREQRGTQDLTLYNYDVPIRTLLEEVGEDLNGLDARSLRQCFLEYCNGKGYAVIKHGATALRMFVRFLIAEGRCPRGLEGAIPLVPYWRLSSLPRYLQPEEVERIVASCDLTTAVGKRDHAILLLLGRLGLRAGDIVDLHLSDLDWQNAWVQVCGKGRRQTRLPLTQELGDALVAYLRHGRPHTDTDRMFVCCRAPFRPFAAHHAVSVIVDRAMRRAGVTPPGRGAAHLLRHSVATSLLRQGASLQDIATVLRHRSIQTTQIYAKVDVSTLSQITQPWPEVQPC